MSTLNIIFLVIVCWAAVCAIATSHQEAVKERRLQKQRKKTALFWRIRDLEMDIYGRWLDVDDNKELAITIEEEGGNDRAASIREDS